MGRWEIVWCYAIFVGLSYIWRVELKMTSFKLEQKNKVLSGEQLVNQIIPLFIKRKKKHFKRKNRSKFQLFDKPGHVLFILYRTQKTDINQKTTPENVNIISSSSG